MIFEPFIPATDYNSTGEPLLPPAGGVPPVGEAKQRPLRLDFNPRLKLEFRGATITSDAGLPAFRELDETLGFSRFAAHQGSSPIILM